MNTKLSRSYLHQMIVSTLSECGEIYAHIYDGWGGHGEATSAFKTSLVSFRKELGGALRWLEIERSFKAF